MINKSKTDESGENMKDVNASIFYKAKFSVQTANGEPDDLLWVLVRNIRTWITYKLNARADRPVIAYNLKKWSEFKKGGKFYDLGHQNRVYAESLFWQDRNNAENVSWACRIIENPDPEPGYAKREWVTEIGYQSKREGTAEISYVVTFSDTPGFIGFPMEVPPANLPKVVRFFLDDPALVCTIGAHSLSRVPIELFPGDYPDFAKVIFDAEREVPIVYISPRCCQEGEGESELLVDPHTVANCVAANAVVYYSSSLDFAREMNYFGNGAYTCSGGAVRIYRPHVDLEAEGDCARHRYLSSDFIEKHGADAVVGILRKAMAKDIYFFEHFFRLDDCRTLLKDQQTLEKIHAIREQSQGEIDEASMAFLEESENRLKWENEAMALKNELNRFKTENYNMGIQIETLRNRANRCAEVESAVQQLRSVSDYPNTPVMIARYFEQIYGDRIAFTARAYRSLEECHTKCDLLWNAFYSMAIELYPLLKDNPASAYKEFTEKTGWSIGRGEGAQTRADSKLMREYVDTYNGHQIDIEPHVKNGSKESDSKFVRIHFAFDPSVENKIIIGHCGKHLDNFSTRKARR